MTNSQICWLQQASKLESFTPTDLAIALQPQCQDDMEVRRRWSTKVASFISYGYKRYGYFTQVRRGVWAVTQGLIIPPIREIRHLPTKTTDPFAPASSDLRKLLSAYKPSTIYELGKRNNHLCPFYRAKVHAAFAPLPPHEALTLLQQYTWKTVEKSKRFPGAPLVFLIELKEWDYSLINNPFEPFLDREEYANDDSNLIGLERALTHTADPWNLKCTIEKLKTHIAQVTYATSRIFQRTTARARYPIWGGSECRRPEERPAHGRHGDPSSPGHRKGRELLCQHS